jgi:hypothetical protein
MCTITCKPPTDRPLKRWNSGNSFHYIVPSIRFSRTILICKHASRTETSRGNYNVKKSTTMIATAGSWQGSQSFPAIYYNETQTLQ